MFLSFMRRCTTIIMVIVTIVVVIAIGVVIVGWVVAWLDGS